MLLYGIEFTLGQHGIEDHRSTYMHIFFNKYWKIFWRFVAIWKKLAGETYSLEIKNIKKMYVKNV